jgi:hypothetical protein
MRKGNRGEKINHKRFVSLGTDKKAKRVFHCDELCAAAMDAMFR